VKLAAGDSSWLDFALQQGTVLWSDLSMYQGKTLLPPGKGKDILTGTVLRATHSKPAWPP